MRSLTSVGNCSVLLIGLPLAGFVALVVGVRSSEAGVVTWDGSCGSANWLSTCNGGTMTNWDDDGIPSLGSIVSIPMGSPIVAITGNAAASLLTCGSGLSITGGALELATGGTISGLHINTISVFGIRLDSGVLSLANGANWEYGRVTGNGTVDNNGLLLGRTMLLEDTTQFNNNDVMEMAFISLQGGCTFTNTADGWLKMSVPSPLTGTYINGNGTFYNSGILEFLYSGASHTIDVACPYVQLGGTMKVMGASPGSGTRLENDTNFNGGEIQLQGEGNLFFRNDGGNATHVINGLSSISGNGNAFVAMLSTAGSDDFRIESDVTVNLTGLAGFTMTSAEPMTLTAVLTNQGYFAWSGGAIQHGSCGTCSPELRNEGAMDIYTSGVTLNTWLHNMSGGTIVHGVGSINLGDQGVITNLGTYEHRNGTIQRVSGTTNGSFTNYGQYIRPNIPQTVDATVHAPFTLNPGSTAQYEKAVTTYLTSGLSFNGGDAFVISPGVVRVGAGQVEADGSHVSGTGEFHIGGVGGITNFNLGNSKDALPINMGSLGLPPGLSPAGMYLDVGGRITGPGTVINNRRCFWAGGAVGNSGAGHFENWGDVFLSSGQVIGPDATFVNHFGDEQEYGVVTQIGTFTINNGLVTNRSDWFVLASTNLQGFGSHEFFNDQGMFLADPGAGGVVTVSAAFNNAGDVEVDSGTLQFTGPVAQVSAGGVGGRWFVLDGATLDLPGAISVVKPDGELIINGTWNDLNVIHTNQGLMSLRRGNLANRFSNIGGMTFTNPPGGEPVRIQTGSGTATNALSGYIDQKVVLALAGGSDAPFALQCASLTNAGTIRPGGVDAPGPFKLDANLVSQSTAVLQIELGGTTPVDGYDQLIVDGDVTLAGTLGVRVLPGFTPSAGQQFTIITASNGTIAGTFDQITGFGSYSLTYGPNAVTLTVINPPEPGDTNGDGQVNVTDLLAIISQWGMCFPPPTFCSGDLNGDGLVNVTDLLAVIANWG